MSTIHCHVTKIPLFSLKNVFIWKLFNWVTQLSRCFHMSEELNKKMFGEFNKRRPYIKYISMSCIVLKNMFNKPFS